MDSTSISLLNRLRATKPPEDAWARFVELYAPLLYHWGRSHQLSSADAGDLVQDVLTVLLQKLPEFEYDPNRRFRGWLRTLTVNKARDLLRRQSNRPDSGSDETIDYLESPNNVDLFVESEYRSFLV